MASSAAEHHSDDLPPLPAPADAPPPLLPASPSAGGGQDGERSLSTPLLESRNSSQPAAALVLAALRPECSVDFPQITEICERLEVHPAEMKPAVGILVQALRDKRQPLRVKLKALTIANEMLYNAQVVDAFRNSDGLHSALETLRNTRGGELGAAMDENIRMLATEIDSRCFAEKLKTSTNGGWSSFTKAMSSDLEKARLRAKKNLQAFSQKAEKTMEKAERAIERGATMVMQEAEQMFSTPLPGPNADGNLAPTEHAKPAPRKHKPKTYVSSEDEQLQWALNASLAEAQSCASDAPKTSQPHEEQVTLLRRIHECKTRAANLVAQASQAASELETLRTRGKKFEDQMATLSMAHNTAAMRQQQKQQHLLQRVADLESHLLVGLTKDNHSVVNEIRDGTATEFQEKEAGALDGQETSVPDENSGEQTQTLKKGTLPAEENDAGVGQPD
eukprot:TRINITY_DN34934_c0_g1_i1.p1 TRINITY_DN34934_c0_g1~~TRINITY_DN34934_c0_g1_i1.p1  ORF type:complete len:449 (-),score=117.19 TRINITY_DN34934_c0_g1_i1:133-1479(-)